MLKELNISTPTTLKDFISLLKGSRGVYKKIYEAYLVFKEMIQCRNCFKFLSFTEHIIREPISFNSVLLLIEHKLINAIMTYSSVIDFDILRTLNLENEKSKDRILNKLLTIVNDFITSYEEKINKKQSPSNILRLFGLYLYDKLKVTKNSILIRATLHDIPIFVPDFTNTYLALSLLTIKNKLKINLDIDVMRDEQLLCDIMFENKKIGAIFLVGSLPKHHVQWWAGLRGGLDYAIQITTRSEFNGSLSGAKLSESITWHQLRPVGKGISILGDPILIFPLIVYALINELNIR